MNKRFLDWDDINHMVDRLATNIKSSKLKLDAVYGLARGGLIPAVMLSHRLNLPYIELDYNNDKYNIILVVDDICDSGYTLEKYKEYQGSIYTATLHYKNSATYEPHFWVKLASESEWIVYPWETEDSEMVQDYKINEDGE